MLIMGMVNPETYLVCGIDTPILCPIVGVRPPIGAKGGTCDWDVVNEVDCCCCRALGKIIWSSSGWCNGVPVYNLIKI